MNLAERITDLERRQAARHLLNLGQFRDYCPEEAWPYEALRRLDDRDPGNVPEIEAVLNEAGL